MHPVYHRVRGGLSYRGRKLPEIGRSELVFSDCLASAFIYLVAIRIVATDSEIIDLGAVFGASYVAACYAVWIGFLPFLENMAGLHFGKGRR